MKRFLSVFVVCVIFSFLGCSTMQSTGLAPKPAETVDISNPRTITIVLPNSNLVDTSMYSSLRFQNRVWGVSYYDNRIAKQEVIRSFKPSANSIYVERRTANQTTGSGRIYTLNYEMKEDGKNKIMELKPISFRTYQQGLVGPFPVPNFTEDSLFDYIISHYIGYTIEINSQYNTESIFSNFERLAKKVAYKQGAKDEVTGKIFKNRFSIVCNGSQINFSLETYPYRNGSKAVIYANIPGSFTSQNKVDFNIIIDDFKRQIESIVNS